MALLTIEQDGIRKTTSGSFFRGDHTNFHPTVDSLERPDAIEQYIMKGWAPPEKFVTENTPIVAFGSCFAGNISKYLHARNYNVLTKKENKAYVTQMGDGMVNTFAILQQFEWAWRGKVPKSDLWQGYSAEDFGYDEAVRRDTKALFDEAELFIITLGLSEIWYDEPTGEVFWRAVPKGKYDPSRHKFRVASFEETKRNLHSIRTIIREFRPDARILFSVSPIPLTATFRPVTCLAANAASKAILRGACDEFFRECDDKNLFYFPSYETVMHVYNNQWGADRKHVDSRVLHFIMQMFEYFYCSPGLSRETLARSYTASRENDRRLGETGGNQSGRKYQDEIEAKAIKQNERRMARIEARKQERLAARQPASDALSSRIVRAVKSLKS